MNLITKLKLKFHNLLGFEKLNPINNFDFNQTLEENYNSNNLESFKNIINTHEDLKDIIWIGIYHCLNTFDEINEFLTVLDKNNQLIADLLEGDDSSVNIPNDIKLQIENGNVLATFHNHFNGAIIPSSRDLKNTILPFLKFMVITSKENIGIVVNSNEKMDETFKKSLRQEWLFYLAYINWSFNNDMSNEIQQVYDKNLTKIEKQKQEQILFDNYICLNLHKFINEFNIRMKKYNVYFLQIIIKG